MRSLKESILDDIDVSLENGDKLVDKKSQFAGHFSFHYCECRNSMGSYFNGTVLKRLTKDMEYMSDKIENGQFDKANKIKMFLNWLDHVKFEDLGYTISNILSANVHSDEFRKEFANRLTEYGVKSGVFNKPNDIYLWCPTHRFASDADLEIFITTLIKDGWQTSRPIRIMYKIK